MILPVLAADIGNYIGLAILVITVLGWIVNAIKGNDADGKPLPQRNKPKRDLRSELEVFLEELQQPQQQPQEPVRRPERPANPVQSQKQKQQANRQRPPKAPKPQPTLAKTAQKPQKAKSLSSQPSQSLRDHVASFMGDNRVAAEVQQHLAHRVDQSVEQNLSGGTVAPVEAAQVRRAAPHPLLSLLARPEGMRQAILMNEILERPKALRSRKA